MWHGRANLEATFRVGALGLRMMRKRRHFKADVDTIINIIKRFAALGAFQLPSDVAICSEAAQVSARSRLLWPTRPPQSR